MTSFLRFLLEGAVFFVLPVVIVSTAVQAFMPGTEVTKFLLLVLSGFLLSVLLVYASYRQSQTGLEVVFLLPLVLAVLVGNFAALWLAPRVYRMWIERKPR